MQQTYIADLSKHAGEEVTLKGWIYNLRSSGKILFPQLRDGTGIVQCVVVKNSVTPELWESLKGLGQESALVVTGSVREDKRAPGGHEIDVTGATVLQNAQDYPISPKEHGTEFLMDHRHLWLRSRRRRRPRLSVNRLPAGWPSTSQSFPGNSGFSWSTISAVFAMKN